MKTFYGAHPFDSRKEFRVWELHLESHYSIEIINPFYDLNRTDVVNFDQGLAGRYCEESSVVVQRDLDAIHKAKDGVIFYLPPDTRIIGTYQEMVYAHLFGRETYTIAMNGEENHYWVQHHSTDVFLNTGEFEEWLDLNV
jgi:hypothetical protein